ncbi:MAG: hypothetical protein PHD88_07990 [Firmicutes bacterium]|nr:hypothetical protein [Bacillota bacterium]MDD4694320.1 hypothetical protein [Bacillota bacterium]
MPEYKETYKIIKGSPLDESLFVRQQIIGLLKNITEKKQTLVGYREYDNMLGVPSDVVKTVEMLSYSGLDVIQTGACTLPEISLQARLMGATGIFLDDDASYYLDSTGSYLDGDFPIVRLERLKRGKISRINSKREYVRHLRRETAVDRLKSSSIAIGGITDNTLLSLLAQVFPFKGLWRVRSETDLGLANVADSVLRMQASLGIKLDSTGTKVEFVDDQGTQITNAVAGALIARYLKELGNLSSVSKDWGVSRFFDRVVEKSGLKVEKNADFLVGEEIIYKPHLGVGDGLWLGFMLAEISAVLNRPLSELIAEMYKVVGKTETKLLPLEKNELENYLRKVAGKKYSLEDKGELQLNNVVVAWKKLNNNLYHVLLDGEPSKLHSLQTDLPLGIS